MRANEAKQLERTRYARGVAGTISHQTDKKHTLVSMGNVQNISKIAAHLRLPGRCQIATCGKRVEYSDRVYLAVMLVATVSVGHVLSL